MPEVLLNWDPLSNMQVNMFRVSVAPIVSLLLRLALGLLAGSAAAVETGPQGVVRQFCQADALGRRVNLPTWAAVAPLVTWSYEPAWDQAVLITSYTVDSPQAGADGVVSVAVRYAVAGTLSALGLDSDTRVETVAFHLRSSGDAGWRIEGPPLPPHLFGNRVDVEQMRRSFEQGGVGFVPNTLFIWQMFRSAGWQVEFRRSLDLLDGTVYSAVEQPRAGDVIVYLQEGVPYHAGLMETESQIVSSTLNAGIVRTAVDAFTGDVKYLRLLQPDLGPDGDATATPEAAAETVPTPAATPVPRLLRKPTPALRGGKRPLKRTAKPAKPSASKRVKKKLRTKKHRAHPTPVATGRRR